MIETETFKQIILLKRINNNNIILHSKFNIRREYAKMKNTLHNGMVCDVYMLLIHVALSSRWQSLYGRI